MSIENGSFLYSKVVVASIFRTTTKTINGWIENGCPIDSKRGTRHMFDLREVVAWRVKFVSGEFEPEAEDIANYNRERALREQARREIEQINLALLKGDITNVSEVAAKWQQIAVALRTKFLAIPTKLAAKLGTARNVSERQAIIEKVIGAVLNELSDEAPGLEKSSRQSSNAVLGKNATATKAKSKRVVRPKTGTKSRK